MSLPQTDLCSNLMRAVPECQLASSWLGGFWKGSNWKSHSPDDAPVSALLQQVSPHTIH